MKITNQEIEKYVDEIFTEMSKMLNSESIKAAKKNFSDNHNKNMKPKVFSPCIEKFIQAELDFVAQGNRGIGRLTENLPRLGAYFRDQLQKLHDTEIKELDSLITKLITKSYLFTSILQAKPKEKVIIIEEGDKLYREWIPKIYTFNLNFLSDNAGNLLFMINQNDVFAIKKFFEQHSMKGGGFWNRDKTDDILFYYMIAGVSLYATEKLKVA